MTNACSPQRGGAATTRRRARSRERRRLGRAGARGSGRARPASPSTSTTTPALVVAHEAREPELAREPVGRAGGSRRPARCPRRGRAGARARGAASVAAIVLDELAQHVPRGRLRLLDARDVLRARDDDVVGELLGGDAPAVVAHERDRRQPAAARLARAPRSRWPSCRSSRSPAARRRRSRTRSPAARRSPPCRCRWRSR